MKTQLIMMGICLLIGGYIGYSIKPDKDCPDVKPNTLIEYRFIEKTDTLIVPKFKTVVYKDTISYTDTVFIHTNINYIAEVDTTYTDSTLTAHVQFVSPIPLSPKSYFNMKFGVRERSITNTVVQTEKVGFWYKRFVASLGIGVMYDIDRQTLGVGPVLSFGIRLN